MFELRFEKEGKWYPVNATESGVTASKFTDPPTDTTVFGVIQFWSPNTPYVALRSNQQHDGHNLFLSSNGAGYMKLKRWNKPVPESPFTTPQVDPALLFRVVRPLDQE
ncbi:Hypothetical predicted protein [Paramuricea clavata]|uniref:Uncharacterized protein n=1 Tax=Paramuricea clavata TaxID=317549 RepID=A0A7D9IN48_PARCT|nr:Hypothetical predicted protein [Paramuricea clavata]